MVPVASWHSHPLGDPTRSEVDLSNWAEERIALGLACYVGIVAVPGARGWDEPQLSAWILRPSISGRFDLAEPAQLFRR
jgi:proteasome lid subunit RPN8/RPN11